MRSRLFLLTGILTIVVPLTYGQVLTDPATLFTGSDNCSIGCSSTGGEPSLLGTTATVDVYQNQGAQGSQSPPTITSGNLLLILAVPNGQGAPPAITGETDDNPSQSPETGNAVPISTSSTTTLSSGEDVYSVLNLNGGNNSNSFINLTCAPGTKCASKHSTGIPAADLQAMSFTLYEYEMTDSSLESKGYSQFEFASDLPLGTYAIAYGCTSTFGSIGTTFGCLDSKDDTKFSMGDTYSTPFTNAGLVDGPPVTPTPEPADAVLLATMLLGCGVLLRRRYRFAGRK